jgi:CRP/FNR family transcriptional regulator, cyclic AMP receptor protein
MAADGKIEALRSVSLFSDLRQRDLEQVAQLADEVDLPAGHVLMREGENGSQMFIIASGEARVEHGGQQIAILGPGAVLGEMALVAEGPRVATATLTQPAHLFVLAHREFHSLMETQPAVRDCVLNEVARRLRELEPEKAH